LRSGRSLSSHRLLTFSKPRGPFVILFLPGLSSAHSFPVAQGTRLLYGVDSIGLNVEMVTPEIGRYAEDKGYSIQLQPERLNV
jgi:hypothetical protein